ncbi:MAG TPA: pantoate--beta-alanine ligase [Acidimicrobiales bacterium]|nr:pantoate--beta-alanine ligase [Acidimicrobiales bacterium]
MIEVHETIADLRAALESTRRAGRSVGLVPTMGALHAGHASLITRAASDCDVVVVTVFVNPLQFGAGEDLGAYPRSLAADIFLADESGAAHVFAPSTGEMYGAGPVTTVAVDGPLTNVLEGASRPTHFDGVTTVVAKLFAIVGACSAYFGEKDFQQLAVVRRMTADLSFPVRVVGCPTVRDPDGLALSSRNAYLEPDERRVAPLLHRSLVAGADCIRGGERQPAAVTEAMASVIATEPMFDPDYVAVVDAATFETPDPLEGDLRLLAAARLGKARLIDNLGVTVSAGPSGRLSGQHGAHR